MSTKISKKYACVNMLDSQEETVCANVSSNFPKKFQLMRKIPAHPQNLRKTQVAYCLRGVG